MKSDGNKSKLSGSSSSGLIKILANGVAVKPTYVAVGNLLNMPRMHLLIAVGLFPGLAVLIEALSASSSIMRMLLDPYP